MAKPTPDNVKEVYECLIDCVFYARPFEDIEPHIGKNVMLFGTAKHEKITNRQELHDLFLKQNKEFENLSTEVKRSGIIFEKYFADGKGCILCEEFDMTITDLNHSIHMRGSGVFEMQDEKWICLHFHGSTPDANIDENESLPVEGLAKKNKELEEIIAARTEELKISLESLKATQSQLIHSEKMASLGELTAGIAHEIQNPLNFVNNFAEVNRELTADLEEALENGALEEVKAISRSIAENQEKINHHGKRADGIVRGMLQHSRESGSEREPTDINNLCDEYLRLAYHGLRAKDKSFNAKFETDFDESLEKVNVVPQEIGRVILNLLNNAFFATNDKRQRINLAGLNDPQGSDSYGPSVHVTTKNMGDKVEIRVRDNGDGIPEDIKNKIFQPFFTTKPTGSGTGLGLSLSYDIVKAHGGELGVESNEGAGTEFIIYLPKV